MNLLYLNNIDSTMYDQYNLPVILGNLINDKIHFIQRPENCVIVDVPDAFKYRPERVANQYYGHESFYPIILAANNIGSLFQFIPSDFDHRIKLVKSSVISQLLNI